MKKIVGLLFGLILVMIFFFNPLKELSLNWLYPNYSKLTELGYSFDEIKNLKENLSDEQFLRVIDFEKSDDILKIISVPYYRDLKDQAYLEEEINQILNLSDDLIQFYLRHDNLSEYHDLMQNPYFIIERFDRYLKYTTKYSQRDLEECIRLVNANRDYILYTHIEAADTSNPTQVLVNKYYQLAEDYVPDLKETYLGFMMQTEAADALTLMISDMLALNIDISISNTYRSYLMQERIYNRYLETQSQNVVDSFSARPGHSEHQAGLAVDFMTNANDITDFGSSEAYQWLKENAHIYGFIQRYTEENSIYTGYMAEEWHFRYVGNDLAQIVFETNLSLEEVLLLFR